MFQSLKNFLDYRKRGYMKFLKENITELKLMFTRITSQILFIDSIVLLIFKGKEARILATDGLAMVAIGAVCAFFYVVLLYDKEISKKKMFLLQLAYFVIIDAISVAAGWFLHWFSFCRISSFFAFESVVLGVILLTILYSYRQNQITSNRMNEKLKKINQED